MQFSSRLILHRPASDEQQLVIGRYKLILLNNRDEEFDRPTTALSWRNGILGGWDQQAEERGTWLAIDAKGRIGNLLAITQPKHLSDMNAPSRGRLVNDFLTSDSQNGLNFLSKLSQQSEQFNGFQMVLLDRTNGSYELYSLTNKLGPHEPIHWKMKGVFAFGNSPTEIPFRKVRYGEHRFCEILHRAADLSEDDLVNRLFELASDRTLHFPDEQIRTQTGTPIGDDSYKFLSSIFVDGLAQGRKYGTRSSSVILVDSNDTVVFCERRLLDPMKAMDDPKKWAFETVRFSI